MLLSAQASAQAEVRPAEVQPEVVQSEKDGRQDETRRLGIHDVPSENPAQAEATRRAVEEGAGFGPEVVIERIEISGNTRTADRQIIRTLLVREGERLRVGDPRLVASRFRLMALGYFVEVKLGLSRGSRRGAVILTIVVVERGTLILQRLYWGASEATPWWAGLDVADSNVFGTGIELGVAAAWAGPASSSSVETGGRQSALRIHYENPTIGDLAIGAGARIDYTDASEPFACVEERYCAFRYQRLAAEGGISFDLTRTTSLKVGARIDSFAADVPTGASDVHLLPGQSIALVPSFGVERDTRVDPVLPWAGDHMGVAIAGGEGLFGDYPFLRVEAHYRRWFPLRRQHVISIRGAAGATVGQTPRPERFYQGDWNMLLPQRALDLVVSTRRSASIVGNGSDAPAYGTAAALLAVEYSYRLFRQKRLVYGGDLYVGVGVFAVGDATA
ncbi:MAG: BamA/TamA family outer membrane protein, partial [Pseudomonadota bacterium]